MGQAVSGGAESTETPNSIHVSRDRLAVDPAVRTARTYLRLPPTLSFASWKRVGRQLFLISDSSAWWLGDWLVFGAENYRDRYRRAVTETGLTYGTLRNYAWVARRFEASRRHDGLSFQHHFEVASLPETEQDLWLARAAELGWSKRRLREELRSSRGAAAEQESPPAVHVEVIATRQQRELWQQAAESTRSGLAEWISRILDQAARSALKE
ncbi:LmbU family transcriptional regulator [Spirillospora sp. CA-128828]|uniref:LmbU family transcriptional regulator n=1 Tax=Spirillospora sp. CA-128828 TaxID=3240033 RepID=UPI003D8BCCEA